MTIATANTASAVKSTKEVVEEKEEKEETKEEAKLGEKEMTFRHNEVAQIHLDRWQARHQLI